MRSFDPYIWGMGLKDFLKVTRTIWKGWIDNESLCGNKECMIWDMRTQTRRSLKTLTVVVFFLTVFFIAFFDTSKNLPSLAIVNPFADDPYDAVGSFGIQLSFFAALLSLIRVFRPYRTKEIPPTQRLLILHGEIVALLSIMVTLAIDTVAMFRYPSMWLDSPSGRILAILIGGLIVLTALIGLLLSRFVAGLSLSFANRSWRRAIPFPISLFVLAFYPSDLLESIPGGILSALLGMVLLFISVWALATALFPHTDLEFEDVLDDLTSIYQSIKFRLGIAIGLERFARVKWLHRILDWLNPRRHEWNFIIAIAIGMGGLLMLVEAINEGLSQNASVILLVLGVFLGIEAAGILLGYYLLGGFLELSVRMKRINLKGERAFQGL